MSELQPSTVSALDQFSGLVADVAAITTAHHQRLLDGHLPTDLARELTADLHDALLAVFILPKPEPVPPSED